MKRALLISIIILTAVASITTPAHADVVDNLLNKLRAKKLLTEAEYQEMRAEVEYLALRAEVEAEKKRAEAEANKSDLIAKFKDGFILESKDKQNSLAFIGRVHADYRYFTPNTPTNPSTFEVRRAYLGVKGKVYGEMEFEVSGDFAGKPELKKAWINFDAMKSMQFQMGQFTLPFGLESMMSSNKNDFQESALATRLTPGEEPGAMVHGAPFGGFTYALAMSNGSGANANSTRDNKDSISRLTFNFAEMLNAKNVVTHLGLAYSDGIESNSTLTDKIKSEGRGVATIFQGTAPTGAQSYEHRRRGGLEVALAVGSFKLQGEKVWVKFDVVNADGSGSLPNIDASYVSAVWVMTGESWADTYKNGEFNNIKPFKKGDGHAGAWALGLRYSTFHADDFVSYTGTTGAKAGTAGLNWMPNNMARVMLNYVYTQYDTPIAAQLDEKAVTLRAQLSW